MNLDSNEYLTPINETITLISRKGGLTFGTDAYLLSAFVRNGKQGIGADFGSGTGVLSLLCGIRRNYSKIVAYEVQPIYASLTKKNAEYNHLSSIISVEEKDIRFIENNEICIFDTIWSNPPYLPNTSGFESANPEMEIARRENHGSISDFCHAAFMRLKTGGHFYIVYRADRVAELMSALCSEQLEPKKMIFVYPSLTSSPNLVLIQSQKGAKSGIRIARPLVIYDNNHKYTPDFQQIYDTFSLDFLF